MPPFCCKGGLKRESWNAREQFDASFDPRHDTHNLTPLIKKKREKKDILPLMKNLAFLREVNKKAPTVSRFRVSNRELKAKK